MILLGSTKSKIPNDENGENLSHLVTNFHNSISFLDNVVNSDY